MSFVAHVALVSEAANVGIADVTNVSAALQKQVVRDLGPAWDIAATVDAFPSLDQVPPGYWPIIVRDDITENASGVHCDPIGQPMALVISDKEWSVTASHELLEMLVDPFGNTLIAGQSLSPNQGRVQFLVEVADPISDVSYTVNGVQVSDFFTRRYFDPVKSAGVQYSFTGSISQPLQILKGGYITWFDAVSNQWWQQSWFDGDSSTIRSLGVVAKMTCGMRPAIDRLTRAHQIERTGRAGRAASPPEVAEQAAHFARGVAASGRAKAQLWRNRIREINGEQPTSC